MRSFRAERGRGEWLTAVVVSTILAAAVGLARAQEQAADAGLAQELTNPLADLITLPVQVNFDRDLGPADRGTRTVTNVQPVIPFSLSEEWNLISRTIIPIVYQDDVLPGQGSQFGLGDVNLSLFFSPKAPTAGGVIWGVGPVMLLPTATDSLLGGRKWGAGPAGVVLTTRGSWTVGALANHVWSFAGDDARQDISNTFVQPFLAYTWPNAWTLSVQSESSYNWKSEQWSIPINVSVSKLVRIGRLPVSLAVGVGQWLESPAAGPEGIRFRLQANLVLPKRR